jgi:hypothetical protein
MPEIITPKALRAWSHELKLVKIKPISVYDIKMSSVQELLELSDSYGVKFVMQVGKQYIFKHEGLYYYAKG